MVSMNASTYASLTILQALWPNLNQLPTIMPSLLLMVSWAVSSVTPAPTTTGKSPRVALNCSTLLIGVSMPVPLPVQTTASQRSLPRRRSSSVVLPEFTGWYLNLTPPNTATLYSSLYLFSFST